MSIRSIMELVNALKNDLELNSSCSFSAKELIKVADAVRNATANQKIAYEFLNLARLPKVQTVIYNDNRQDEWCDKILKIVCQSNLTFGRLFEQRVSQYGNKPLFQVVRNGRAANYSWRYVATLVKRIAKSLLYFQSIHEGEFRVAYLSENRLEMACIDLACIYAGVVNIPIPTNSTGSGVEYILAHSSSAMLILSGAKRLAEFNRVSGNLNSVKWVVLLADSSEQSNEAIDFRKFLAEGERVTSKTLNETAQAVDVMQLATIMYTSGTTEMPKGIMFSHANIICKRFSRAIALPEIGDDDKFVCFLPLFHTFGRYFEMMGCIFWGATYVFLENPRIETIVQTMQLTHPTTFISIPKKWIQLHEQISQSIDIHRGRDEDIKDCIRKVTGGKLKWGLSAAGYLAPEIFKFFQEYEVQLLSGFGMTEATGGVTMTPPFQYVENSVGVALPGIEIKLAKDGEMLIRGPYVMMGYLNEADSGLDKHGWLGTGDIFMQDKSGHYRIIDRKKEIYKNVRGETISPQKIENLFVEFEAVQWVFLVGDHREHNTVLIYPNYENEQIDLTKMSIEELRIVFSSLIVSVNQFLSPYERIINFKIIGRDFSAEKGELTAKGTYKRKVIESHFKESIAEMYELNYTKVKAGEIEVRIPSWLFKEKGLTSRGVFFENHELKLNTESEKLTLAVVTKVGDSYQLQIGSCFYTLTSKNLDLNQIIGNRRLSLGNMELFEFVGSALYETLKPLRASSQAIELQASVKKLTDNELFSAELDELLFSKKYTLRGLYLAGYIIMTADMHSLRNAVAYLIKALEQRNDPTFEPAKIGLMRAAHSSNIGIKRQAFIALILNENRDRLQAVLEAFLETQQEILNPKTIDAICLNVLSKHQLNSLIAYLQRCHRSYVQKESNSSQFPLMEMIQLLTDYGGRHPLDYKQIRTTLVNLYLFPANRQTKQRAKNSLQTLNDRFRKWLGQNQQIAIDYERQKEFGWRDALSFSTDVSEADRERLEDAITNAPVIREAIFLFYKGRTIRLEQIVLNGVRIKKIGAQYGKTVFGVSVKTFNYGSFDLAINLNQTLPIKDIQDEMNWLICASAKNAESPLVENFGGYWPLYNLWTEEFIPGDNVEQYMHRFDRQMPEDNPERFRQIWISFAWNGLSAFIDFWRRTGCKYEIEPKPDNVIIPLHDFQVGFRIVSIAGRYRFQNVVSMIAAFYQKFVMPIEKKYTNLTGHVHWDILFSAFLEILGEKEGLSLLEKQLKKGRAQDMPTICHDLLDRMKVFVEQVRENGYQPERIYFAIKRFQRWHSLNSEATAQARLQTLNDLRTTYTLDEVEKRYPGSRIQFFRDTVFDKSTESFKKSLNKILKQLKNNEINYYDLYDRFAELRREDQLSEDYDKFLTRLSYPHLGVEDNAQLIWLTSEGVEHTALVVFAHDNDGNRLAIREPASPKEIAHLHTLFTQAKLAVDFRPEHKFLIILSPRGLVIGGLFYRVVGASQTHLEKVVVDKNYRGHKVSDALMKEFLNRIKNEGTEVVSVGFLRPNYFYTFGFRVDQRYGNMVLKLNNPESEKENLKLQAARSARTWEL